MIANLLLVGLLLSPAPAAPGLKEVKAEFEALHAKQDRAGCVALWKAHPDAVLAVIDRDLEGSLKLFESPKSGAPDPAAIAALHARALWGAQAAVDATGHPILLEYASSFVGWDDEQKKTFRGGQKAFGTAMKALEKGDAKAALDAANDCVAKATSLGDWWGAAMGLDAQGRAHAALGAHAESLKSFGGARLVYHDLGLVGDEYGAAQGIVAACASLDRAVRGRAAASQAIELAKRLGDAKGAAELYEARAKFEEKLGDAAAAAATRAEAKSGAKK